jgi:hypothetical protein
MTYHTTNDENSSNNNNDQINAKAAEKKFGASIDVNVLGRVADNNNNNKRHPKETLPVEGKEQVLPVITVTVDEDEEVNAYVLVAEKADHKNDNRCSPKEDELTVEGKLKGEEEEDAPGVEEEQTVTADVNANVNVNSLVHVAEKADDKKKKKKKPTAEVKLKEKEEVSGVEKEQAVAVEHKEEKKVGVIERAGGEKRQMDDEGDDGSQKKQRKIDASFYVRCYGHTKG